MTAEGVGAASPLRAVVEVVVKALVDNLPQGIGEGLKARVVNF